MTINVQSDFIKLLKTRDDEKAEYIDFSVNDFDSFLTALKQYTQAFYPTDYNNFVESDLGVFLLELVAYMGTVLSLKADMLANENFLDTAKDRNSVRKLLQLIGVSMKGPISSVANAEVDFGNAVTDSEVTINASDRVVVITSPEDSAPLNYTLYKTNGGVIDEVNAEGNIALDVSESDSTASAIWSNLALLEGSLVKQTGTFGSTTTVQSINLTETPIVERSVQVYVDHASDSSGAWTQVENLYYASGASDKIFQVAYNDDYSATVLFGDGQSGRQAPVGGTYTVFYRVGGGTRGNILEDAIDVSVDATGITASYAPRLRNSSQATGGLDAESVDSAKKYAPLTFKSQDRLVTLEDYNTFTNSFISSTGSSSKATVATRKAFGSANIIDVYVLEKASNTQLQKASVSFKNSLLEAIEPKKMITDEVVIVDGLVRTVDLVVTITIDRELDQKEEAIKASVAQTIQTYLSSNNRSFGENLSLGALNRQIFKVPDVRFAVVDNYSDDIVIEFNEIIQLNNLTINVNKV